MRTSCSGRCCSSGLTERCTRGNKRERVSERVVLYVSCRAEVVLLSAELLLIDLSISTCQHAASALCELTCTRLLLQQGNAACVLHAYAEALVLQNAIHCISRQCCCSCLLTCWRCVSLNACLVLTCTTNIEPHKNETEQDKDTQRAAICEWKYIYILRSTYVKV
jgi:hypothetical protein